MGPAFLCRGLFSLASLPYAAVTAWRNSLYDRGWLSQHRLPCRVISIGNLTVGGTGKTPVVIWVVDRLMAAGLRVGVLSRGYRRQGRTPRLLVSDGRTILADPAEAGDEPFLIASRCRGALVAVGADRVRLGRWVLDRYPVDCFVLDDGFQHRALHRDVDLVLLDASDQRGLRGLLPLGRLREPLSSLRRATAVLLTRVEAGEQVEALTERVQEALGCAVDPIQVAFRSDRVVDLVTGAVTDLQEASGKRVMIFSGIGNPGSFRRLVERAGLKVVDALVFRDHHRYAEADLVTIRRRAERAGADLIVTTEKDGVKITPWRKDRPSIAAIRLDVEIVKGRDRLERLLLGSAEC